MNQPSLTPEVCEGCLECTKATACPGLTSVDTDYGKKIDTDLTWCVNDGACERVRSSNEYGNNVKPCPSFEQVTIIRNRRKRYSLPKLDLDNRLDNILQHKYLIMKWLAYLPKYYSTRRLFLRNHWR